MSTLTYPALNDDGMLNYCNKKCGIISTSEDFSYFSLGCTFCEEKFLYFDAFIGHIQTVHFNLASKSNVNCVYTADVNNTNYETNELEEDLCDTDPSLLEPQMVMIKEEIIDDDNHWDIDATNDDVSNALNANNSEDFEECPNFEDNSEDETYEEKDLEEFNENEDTNYDDLVEESLLEDCNVTIHIKDRKMIKFLINAYRTNPFLWDHRHVGFRDRAKRQKFIEYMISEFKKRFNVVLARDAISRKWDNLRTVYKRECNRMNLEKTNVSSLWYFKELSFLNKLYGDGLSTPEAIVKEPMTRRRYSTLWNDVSTTRLLNLIQKYPYFYDKFNTDYRNKEKRGEALQAIVIELQELLEVSTIQVSKRISQLRFDYSRQKQERLQCEQTAKPFIPTYSYYEQMTFMDADIAPFKCEYCPMILQTPREMDLHLLTHHGNLAIYACPECNLRCDNAESFLKHQQMHKMKITELPTTNNPLDTKILPKFYCDACTASFHERPAYDEHMRQHNEELFWPSLLASDTTMEDCGNSSDESISQDKPFRCNICFSKFTNQHYLSSHIALYHNEDGIHPYICEYPKCNKSFATRQMLMDHLTTHFTNPDDYRCTVCGKCFKSHKNLQNHKQIHDAVKRYICKVCGAAFAQAAGLYLHKRRHNRTNY